MNHLSMLIFRVAVAASMAFSHGLGKLTGYSTMSSQFPGVFGMNPEVSLILAISAEFFCALAIIAGFATRLLSIPLIVTMAVAFFVIHADDPFGRKELAFMYLVSFVLIFMNGAGRFSLDGILGLDGFMRKDKK